MKELLFQSNQGISFYKEVRKGLCTVKVQTCGTKRMYTLHSYTFPNVELRLKSPFLSWENLNCCNGWTYDETYLYTAVQEGKKLYAGCSVWVKGTDHIQELRDNLSAIKRSLPESCIAGEEQPMNTNVFPFFICRKGSIRDFYDLDQVFSDYELLGVCLTSQERRQISENCSIELSEFAMGTPFDYANAGKPSELVTTGLLLGYPLESTASILMN